MIAAPLHDPLLATMTAVAAVLYGMIGERAWLLFGPMARRARRRDEIARLLAGGGSAERLAWAARYLALAEESELSRGFLLIRVLTAALPLLGLLGTVAGMGEAFGGLAQTGAVAARTAGAGVGLALRATQLGMALAIPAVVAEAVLRLRVQALVEDRERAVLVVAMAGG